VSDIGERFDYILGLYWFKTDFFVDRRTDVDINLFFLNPATGLFFRAAPFNAFFPDPDPRQRYSSLRFLDQTAETYSAYAQGTWHIIPDRLHLTAGVRWMEETKNATDRLDMAEYGTTRFLDPANPADAALFAQLAALNLNQGIFATRHSFVGESVEENVIPEVKLSWDVNEDIMLYGSWTKGYKGGGFNSQSATQNEEDDFRFDPETAVGWELGGKLRLLDRRMNVNFAAFRQDFEDLQLSIWTGTGFFLTNAGSARSQGLEGDVTWQATERLQLNGAFTLLDATYTESVLAACNIGQLNFGQPGCFLIPAPTAANPNAARPVQDFEGKRFAPKYNVLIGGAYVHTFTDSIELMLRADARFVAKGEFALDPTITQPAYQLLDLSATFRSTDPGNRWFAGVTVNNVFDKRRWYYEFEAPAQVGTRIGFPAPGRLATFRVGYQW
jgi:outer membrane receptor protein involved in Fe transport